MPFDRYVLRSTFEYATKRVSLRAGKSKGVGLAAGTDPQCPLCGRIGVFGAMG